MKIPIKLLVLLCFQFNVHVPHIMINVDSKMNIMIHILHISNGIHDGTQQMVNFRDIFKYKTHNTHCK